MPVAEPIDAIVAALEDQVPPVDVVVIAVELPTHNAVSPTMSDGAALTFTVAILEHPRAV